MHLQPAETMDTTMEVEVEELCTSRVASTPSITPAMGLLNRYVLLSASPAVLPAESKTTTAWNQQ